MASGNGPVDRVKIKRMDGQDGAGTNRDGTPYTAQHVEIGTVWENAKGRSIQLAPGIEITYTPAGGKTVVVASHDKAKRLSYINVFSAGGAKRASDDDSDDEDF